MDIFDLTKIKCKRFRVIDFLRKKYPGMWYYDLRSHTWLNLTNGKYVRRCGSLAPRYDGDDDTFCIEYWMYSDKPETIPERVWLF
jgi:hypothetical protein